MGKEEEEKVKVIMREGGGEKRNKIKSRGTAEGTFGKVKNVRPKGRKK